MKNLYLILGLTIICMFHVQTIFASSGDLKKTQTLLQMQEEQEELKKQESILKFQWSTFQLGNESLGDIVKADLSDGEKQQLEEQISYFLDFQSKGEEKLLKNISRGRNIDEIKRDLLNQKHEFYKGLIPFIQIDKLDSFKKYVDSDLKLNEESKKIQVKIEQNDVEQLKRREELYDNRDDYADDLRDNIKKSIYNKVTPKIEIFISQESFSLLTNQQKQQIFSNIIKKFKSAIDNLEESINPTKALEERIIGLEVVVEILENYINEWR